MRKKKMKRHLNKVLTISLAILFTVGSMKLVDVVETNNMETHAYVLSLEAKITDLNSQVSMDEYEITNYKKDIEDLKSDMYLLKIKSELNDCPMCGSRDLSVYEGKKGLTIKCNHCGTMAEFDEGMNTVSMGSIKRIWNGLKIKTGKPWN
jgi:cell division protein FtsL